MRRAPLFVSLLLSAGAVTAQPVRAAAAPTEEIVWTCALDPRGAPAVLCRRGPLGLEVDAALEDEPLPADNHAIRQKLLANGGSNVGRLVRAAPGDYGRLMWRVPLHSPPMDEAWLRVLVESVMCGTEPRCRVDMGPQLMASAQAPLAR
jgi:hypothetical protein